MNKKDAELKAAIAQRNEEAVKTKSSSAHFEAMQAQIREGQTRYWDELQKMKDNEVAIQVSKSSSQSFSPFRCFILFGLVQEEIELLTAEVEAKRAQVLLYEAEKSKADESNKNDLQHANQISV